MKLLKMIKNTDDKKIKDAFDKVKEDYEKLAKEHQALKMNMNEWVTYLQAQNEQLQKRLDNFEKTRPKIIEL